MSFVFRRAYSVEAGLLADLGARTFYDTFAADNDPEAVAAYLAASFGPEIQAAELADPSITFFLAEYDAKAIGYAQLREDKHPECVSGPNPIHLVRIYVSTEWIGSGVGEGLLGACIEEAERAGHRTMWLGVWKKNSRAQRFYRKHSFRTVGERTFELGRDKQRDWIMERQLS